MATAIWATCSPTVRATKAACATASTRRRCASSRARKWKPPVTVRGSTRWKTCAEAYAKREPSPRPEPDPHRTGRDIVDDADLVGAERVDRRPRVPEAELPCRLRHLLPMRPIVVAEGDFVLAGRDEHRAARRRRELRATALVVQRGAEPLRPCHAIRRILRRNRTVL